MQKIDQARTVNKLSVIGILGNIVLSAFKLFSGIIGSSGAMISDAVHSLSDVFATFIAMIGARLAAKAPDRRHPYGHERFECLASVVLGVLLAATGIGIGASGVGKLLNWSKNKAAVPGLLPLIAAVVSIVTKEAMFRYTLCHAKKMNSAAFEADAWHHRSDALSSVGSLAGIAAARLGLPIMDPIASIVICVCIGKVSYDILKKALGGMLDTSCGSRFENLISGLILSVDGVCRIDMLRTRRFGCRVYVDLEIAVDENKSLIEAHGIAENVHHKIEGELPEVKHIMVHVNPAHEAAAA